MTVTREELAEIYLRLLIGQCPNLGREGRLCAMCAEACDALDYDVLYVGGDSAVVTPRREPGGDTA